MLRELIKYELRLAVAASRALQIDYVYYKYQTRGLLRGYMWSLGQNPENDLTLETGVDKMYYYYFFFNVIRRKTKSKW